MRDRDGKSLNAAKPRAVVLDLEVDPASTVTRRVVGDERTGQESRARQYLKAVADAEHERVAREEFFYLLPQMVAHAVAVGLSGSRMIAVGKAAAKNEYLRLFQYGRLRNDVVQVDDVGRGTDLLECGLRLILGIEAVARENQNMGF